MRVLLTAPRVSSSTFVQSILWKINRLDKLKDIKELDEYDARHSPTVVPVSKDAPASLDVSIENLPRPRPRLSDRIHYTCADYHALYLSGKLTPSDVAEALLPLIRRDTSPPGEHSTAFLESKIDLVRAAAEASTKRYKERRPLSVLDGVPIAVKDEAQVDGYKRMLGSKLDFTNKDGGTAWCVERLFEAGAVNLGRTNMHEAGLGESRSQPYR